MLKPKASVVQMTSGPDVEKNLSMAGDLIQKAARADARLVVLPEMFPVMGAEPNKKVSMGETFGDGPIQDFLKNAAIQNKIWVVGGTIPIKTHDDKRVRSACIVYDDSGKSVARYDKMHLFDVCVTRGVEEYKESATIEPGNDIAVIDTPIGRLGLCVCYDLRFPLMLQKLLNEGVEVIAVPTAFTVKTGMAHWELLARTRSIDILGYGLFSCQVGTHGSGKMTYGHSLITNPWGEIITSIDTGVGVITAEIDLQFLKEVRKNLPIIEHQRFSLV